jgi:L,D-transpeptidase catalytic domain
MLRLGSRGSAVVALQQRLITLHYFDVATADGCSAGTLTTRSSCSRGYALHGMTSVSAYPASHGCVRMTVPTMDRMWSSLWIGMPVAIYSS